MRERDSLFLLSFSAPLFLEEEEEKSEKNDAFFFAGALDPDNSTDDDDETTMRSSIGEGLIGTSALGGFTTPVVAV